MADRCSTGGWKYLKRYIKKEGGKTDREGKWLGMIHGWSGIMDGSSMFAADRLEARVRKGIPDSLRGLVWCLFLNTKRTKELHGPPPSLEQINATLPPIVIEDIDKDIDRTYPLHVMFMSPHSSRSPSPAIAASAAVSSRATRCGTTGRGQENLRLLLERYAVIDQEVR